MFDKLKFNNLIISNAKEIQKIRIQIVRKIIKRMRKLKAQIDKQPNHESNIVKLRKCVAIVERAKKIKRVDIVRSILLLEKNPNKIVTNSHSTPEEVAIAMIATNKNMQALAERFRQELNYNDTESESWKKTLVEIGKERAKKQSKKKRAEQKDIGPNKKPTPKRVNEFLEESEDIDNEESNSNLEKPVEKQKTKEVKSLASSEKPTKAINSNKENLIDYSSKKCKKEDLLIGGRFEDPNTTIIAEKVEKANVINSYDTDDSITVDQVKEPQAKKEVKVKSNDEVELKAFSCYKRSHNDEFLKKNAKKLITVGVVDPFFRTLTGEAFIANVEVKEDMETLKNSTKPASVKKPKENKKSGFDKPTNKHKSKKFGKDSVQDNNTEKSLHPSWVAKQKQRSITAFQGKKIVFDETLSEEQPISKLNKNSTMKDDLHPSWAAKQKLKPTITEFQGKKITFADDE